MTDALYRVALPGGSRLARGTIEEGPRELLTLRSGDRVRIEMGPLGVLENPVLLNG